MVSEQLGAIKGLLEEGVRSSSPARFASALRCLVLGYINPGDIFRIAQRRPPAQSVPINVCCYSNSDIIVRRSQVTLRAISQSLRPLSDVG